jgi:hypothetical protein
VTTLVSNGITAGIGGGLYGVTDKTLRQQMAVFILKAKHGLCYTPPPCAGVFTDVPCSSNFAPRIEAMAAEGITGGGGNGNSCPLNPNPRGQMAVFITKTFFPDVPCSSNFAPWIEAMAAEGITGGCGGGNFCPQNPVRRDQMAVFLLKAEHGSAYTPPACTGVFLDVTCTPGIGFSDWIERLAAENITGGCGGGNYCPLNPNARGQMAVFITKTFNLH